MHSEMQLSVQTPYKPDMVAVALSSSTYLCVRFSISGVESRLWL